MSLRARSALAVLGTFVLTRAVAACVDGVTPDCSVESVCAPIEGDAAATPSADATANETGTEGDAGSEQTDASADAADADGG